MLSPGDDLSNTSKSGLGYFFLTQPLTKRVNDIVFQDLPVYSTSLYLLPKLDFKMDFVYTAKMKKKHRCVINNKTANHVSSQGANPKNAMKRERFGCVSVHKNLAGQSPIRILKCFNFKF